MGPTDNSIWVHSHKQHIRRAKSAAFHSDFYDIYAFLPFLPKNSSIFPDQIAFSIPKLDKKYSGLRSTEQTKNDLAKNPAATLANFPAHRKKLNNRNFPAQIASVFQGEKPRPNILLRNRAVAGAKVA